ncbi:MAG: peptide MFS transporter [Proteobacteria bacterium]|nr:peptide MFS transporter [Pseudomonadota bacterium]
MLTKMGHDHPKGLYLCFSVEMWERFSFYGMRALLVLFMTKFLLLTTEQAGHLYGWYLGVVYLTPLAGGYIADRYWGMNKAIIFGGTTMAIGQLLLAAVAFMSPEVVKADMMWMFYLSLVIIVIGCGFIKANISTAVGTMYEKNDPRRDGAYTIFYIGINLGAFFAPLICGTLGEKVGWGWGFGSAGILMLVGVINYIMYNKKLLPARVFEAANCKKNGNQAPCEPLTKEEKHKIAVIFIMMFFVIFFWASFEQAGSSLTLFADRATNRAISIFGWNWIFPTSWFQSVNPLFIFVLAPLFSGLWVRMAERNIEPSTPFKFVWGLVLLALGFVLMIFAVMAYEKGGPISMLWLLGVYLLHTLGELCLSPVGLSLVTKLSPARFASLLMGTWFMANFIANLASGLFAGNYDAMDHKTFFLIPVITAGAAAILLLLLIKPIKKWMHGIH